LYIHPMRLERGSYIVQSKSAAMMKVLLTTGIPMESYGMIQPAVRRMAPKVLSWG